MVWQREQERRSGRNRWPAFGRAVDRIWLEYRTVRVLLTSDAGRRNVRTPFVFVGNNEYGLQAFRFGGRKHLDGGRLQLCMAPGLRRIDVLPVLLKVLVGRMDTEERFESLMVDQLSIEARRPRLSVSLDGEVVMIETPLHYRSRPKLLRVCVPRPSSGQSG
jgi:diacylglycerol kinase family enzyme